MTKKNTVKTFIIAAAASCCLAATATAQSATNSDSSGAGTGLLGGRYLEVTYDNTHVHDSLLDNMNGFGLRYNQPMESGFDFSVGYDWTRSNRVAGIRAKQQAISASVTSYFDSNGMRPFIEPGVGWTWAKTGAVKTDSFFYYVGAGVEFQVARPLVVTPYVQFVDATSYSGTTWNFGVKSTYRLNKDWGISADLSVDDDRNAGYSLGVNYHF